MSNRKSTLASCLLVAFSCAGSILHASQVVFFDQFTTAYGTPPNWMTAVDSSPNPCTGTQYEAHLDDVDTYVTADNWPGHGRVYVIHANDNTEPGTYANAIGYRAFNYLGAGLYQVDLEMRMWRTDGIYKNQYYGMNLAFVRDRVEHFAEVNIEAAQGSSDYGWLMYRKPSGTQFVRQRLAYAGTNFTSWKRLIVEVRVNDATGYFVLERVWFNNVWYTLNETLPTFNQGWDTSTGLLLESHAKYTNCSPANTFVGIAVFDNVKVSFTP